MEVTPDQPLAPVTDGLDPIGDSVSDDQPPPVRLRNRRSSTASRVGDIRGRGTPELEQEPVGLGRDGEVDRGSIGVPHHVRRQLADDQRDFLDAMFGGSMTAEERCDVLTADGEVVEVRAGPDGC